MTDHERETYLFLCMSGRSREATEYRAECEVRKQADEGAEEGMTDREKVITLSVKIKVSYEHPEELRHILDRLRPDIRPFTHQRIRMGVSRRRTYS